jgi:hypothetical protein
MPENSGQSLMRTHKGKARIAQNLHFRIDRTIKGPRLRLERFRPSRMDARKVLLHKIFQRILEVHALDLWRTQTPQIGARETEPHNARTRVERRHIGRLETHHEATGEAQALLDGLSPFQSREFIRADAKPHT